MKVVFPKFLRTYWDSVLGKPILEFDGPVPKGYKMLLAGNAGGPTVTVQWWDDKGALVHYEDVTLPGGRPYG